MSDFFFSFDSQRDYEEKCENAAAALAYWKEHVSADQVAPHLARWFCGSAACFGGHLTRCLHFQKLGLVVRGHGTSYRYRWVSLGDMSQVALMSETLFGVDDMFSPRDCCKFDKGFSGSDYDLVTNRLKSLLELIASI